MKRALLVFGLVFSLGLNAALLLRSYRGAPAPAPRTEPADSRMTSSGRSTVAVANSGSPACEAQLGALRKESVDTATKLEKALPIHDRFAHGQSNPKAEALLNPELDRLLGREGPGIPARTLECRNDICKLVLVRKAGQRRDEIDKVQDDERLRALVGGHSFLSPDFSNDPVTGESVEEQQMFLQLRDPAEKNGLEFVQNALKVFKASGAIRTCSAQFVDDQGDLDYQVRLEPGIGMRVQISGDLGSTKAGKCVGESMKSALSALTIPDRTTGALVYGRFVLPPTD